MYVPPADLAAQFRRAAALRAEYDALHTLYNPGLLGIALRRLGLRPAPNWSNLQGRLHNLDAAIRECAGRMEKPLKEMENALGQVPRQLHLTYLLVVASANCILALRAIVDSLEASQGDPQRYPASMMMAHQRHYRLKRAEMRKASAMVN